MLVKTYYLKEKERFIEYSVTISDYFGDLSLSRLKRKITQFVPVTIMRQLKHFRLSLFENVIITHFIKKRDSLFSLLYSLLLLCFFLKFVCLNDRLLVAIQILCNKVESAERQIL